MFYYESAGGREIDLVFETKNDITAIEIKASVSVSGRDLRTLAEFEVKKKKPLRRILFYMGKEHLTEIMGDVKIELRPIFSLFQMGKI